eukprot:c6312_g1_i1.p1 GENE.c6312_g1_i1~~c6312_g1_i1.p1  ORF type:complete len:520 (-),score=107.47 c6312_g1_i1:96-1655(-)
MGTASRVQYDELEIHLSLRVTSRIRETASFHEKRLEAISGAKSVKLTLNSESGRMVLKGFGPRPALHRLRLMLHHMSRLSRIEGLCAVISRSDSYFMVGSTMLITRDAKRFPDPMLQFERDVSTNCNHRHAFSDRSVPINPELSVDPDWGCFIGDAFVNHVVCQLNENRPDLSQNIMTCTASFGFFYLLNTERALESFGNSITLRDLESTIARHRHNRRQAWRTEWSREDVEKSRERNTAAQALLKTVEEEKTPGINTKKKKVTISCGFCPSVASLQPSMTKSALDSAMLIVTELLLAECGCVRVPDKRQEFVRLTVLASMSHEVTLSLDKDLKPVRVQERPISWVHFTALSTRTQPRPGQSTNLLLSPHDIRMLLHVQRTLLPGSDLFEFSLPRGDDGTRQVPVVYDPTGRIIIAPHASEEMRTRITFGRTVTNRVCLQAPTKVPIHLYLTQGFDYMGQELSSERAILELTMEIAPEAILTWLENPHTIRDVYDWGREAMGFVKRVSEAIDARANMES